MRIDNQILKSLGLDSTTITIGLDEDIQIALEHKIDSYLKKIDEANERKKKVEFYKEAHENFKKKSEFINMFNDTFVYGKIKNKLVTDGFSYRCPYCLDLSKEYGRPIQKYPNKTH